MNKDSKHGNIGAFLPSILLNRLANRLDEAGLLKSQWQRLLPMPLAGRCHPVRYEGGILQVQTSSAAWATRLRHGQDECLNRLRSDPFFAKLKSLQVRVAPADDGGSTAGNTVPSGAPVTHPLSDTTQQLLRGAADVVVDPVLRESLMRLSGRTDGTENPRKR